MRRFCACTGQLFGITMKFENRFKLPENLPTLLARADDEQPDVDEATGKPTYALQDNLGSIIFARSRVWLLGWVDYFGGWSSEQFPLDDDDLSPLRAELFSADQMEQHGRALAATHKLSRYGMHNRLLRRLDENETLLISSCQLLMDEVKARSRIAPAGEWLLDNFYLIEEQIRTARSHLPKGYSRELPRLGNGKSRGLPRVYDLAEDAIAHGLSLIHI